jgi:FkbM family methyltransferase
MNLLAHPTAIHLRSLLRRWPPVHRTLARLRSLFERGYEGALSDALLELVRPGDCVWDVGANVGQYAGRLAELVGSAGRVVAIEPSPASCAELEKLRASAGPWLAVRQLALGEHDGEAVFSMEGGATGDRNHLAHPGQAGDVRVRVARADSLLVEGERVPNVIKIDVEGFEGEVLQGMDALLSRRELRAVFVEVHFALLSERGKEMEPVQIVERLRNHGFSTQWVDGSHLAARRGDR